MSAEPKKTAEPTAATPAQGTSSAAVTQEDHGIYQLGKTVHGWLNRRISATPRVKLPANGRDLNVLQLKDGNTFECEVYGTEEKQYVPVDDTNLDIVISQVVPK